MGYYIDIEKVTLDDYQTTLESAYLPPSRMMLKERLDERFGFLKSIGVNNVKELIQLLKKKDKFEALSKVECLSYEYLTILLRELNSILPKPNKLADFKGISNKAIEALEKIGINNTEKLYYHIRTKTERIKLAQLTGIDETDILELTKLTDLSRIKWVGATFARMLYDLGVDTVEKVAVANPIELHARINQRNKENLSYKGHIGINDITILVNAAKDVPFEIKY